MGAVTQAKRLRMILSGMFGLAVRPDVMAVNPNEVLAIEWPDVDLLADPPTVTVTGTLIDHGRIAGKPLHRQDKRKHGAPAHTVVLPRFGVDALTALIADTGGLGVQCSSPAMAGGSAWPTCAAHCGPRCLMTCHG